MKYNVEIPELHYLHLEVEAETEDAAMDEAVELYHAGEIDPLVLDFSHVLPCEEWKINVQKES